MAHKISYVNGQYTAHAHAMVHIEDRGYQFADGIYEVMTSRRGVIIDEKPHFVRLKQSLDALSIPMPMSEGALHIVFKELQRRNRSYDCMIYLQVNRGVAKRNHAFPKNTTPSIVITITPFKPLSYTAFEKGGNAITQPDIRWGKCNIKSVSLLPNILAKQKSVEAGCAEALLVNDNGIITEGSSTNFFIVDDKGTIITHPATERILGGITRDSLLKIARKKGLKVEERPFTVEEAKKASEAFITSTTRDVMPIFKIDGAVIGEGTAGSTTRILHALYNAYIIEQIETSHAVNA